MKAKTWMAAAGIAVVTAMTAGSVAAAMMSPMQQRAVVMKGLGGHMKALGAVAKGEAKADAGTVVHAMAVHELSATVAHLFPAGSGGGESRALPKIWEDWDGFVKAAGAFEAATPQLVAAAKTGDAAQIGAALGAVGKTCGGCHKPYRAEKK
jgi:cytochrome c556